MLAWGHASGVGLGSVLRLLCPWALGGGRIHKLGPGGKEVLRREARVAGKFFSFFWTVKLFTVFLQVFLNFNKEYMITVKHTHTCTHTHTRTHTRAQSKRYKGETKILSSPCQTGGVCFFLFMYTQVHRHIQTHNCTDSHRYAHLLHTQRHTRTQPQTIAQTHRHNYRYVYSCKDACA